MPSCETALGSLRVCTQSTRGCASAAIMSDVAENPKYCAKCGVAGCELKCPCKQGYYCSKKCQKDDWGSHKKKCAIALAKAVKEARQEHGREDSAVADARMEAGKAQMAEGRYGEAEKCFVEARRVYLAAHGKGHQKIADACCQLGQLYAKMGRYDESLEVLREGHRIKSRIYGKRSAEAAQYLDMMGATLWLQGKVEEAVGGMQRPPRRWAAVSGDTFACGWRGVNWRPCCCFGGVKQT